MAAIAPPWPEATTAAREAVAAALEALAPVAARRTAAVQPRLARVLQAFQAERIGTHHFASVSGYGHNDQGRDALDRVFARVLGAEQAAVRLQFVSGTHAIAAALFGVLRPGDRLLSITGRPYDTLEEVIVSTRSAIDTQVITSRCRSRSVSTNTSGALCSTRKKSR